MSVANMVGNIPGFLSPQIAGALLDRYGRTSRLAWSIVFGLGGILVIIGGTWFLIFGSGFKRKVSSFINTYSATIQEWDSSADESSEKVRLKKEEEKKSRNRHDSFAVFTN